MSDQEKIKLLTDIVNTIWHKLMTLSDTDRLFDFANQMDEIGVGSRIAGELKLDEMSSDLWVYENITQEMRERGCLNEKE